MEPNTLQLSTVGQPQKDAIAPIVFNPNDKRPCKCTPPKMLFPRLVTSQDSPNYGRVYYQCEAKNKGGCGDYFFADGKPGIRKGDLMMEQLLKDQEAIKINVEGIFNAILELKESIATAVTVRNTTTAGGKKGEEDKPTPKKRSSSSKEAPKAKEIPAKKSKSGEAAKPLKVAPLQEAVQEEIDEELNLDPFILE